MMLSMSIANNNHLLQGQRPTLEVTDAELGRCRYKQLNYKDYKWKPKASISVTSHKRSYREMEIEHVIYIVQGIICIFGISSNVLNLLIWSKMIRKSSISHLLIGLSICDLLSLICFLVYLIVFSVIVVMFHLYILFSNMSVWTTVTLAFFRHSKIVYPLFGNACCLCRKARLTVLTVCICVSVISLPTFFFYEVREQESANTSSHGYWIFYSSFEFTSSDLYQEIVLWVYGSVVKIASCILVAVTTIRMVFVLKTRPLSSLNAIAISGGREYRRTTYMLVLILVIHFTFESPIGVASIIHGIQCTDDDKHHYFFFLSNSSTGGILDMCVLLNRSCNIFVYTGLSSKYRRALLKIMCRRRHLRQQTTCLPNVNVSSLVTTL